MVKDVSKNKEKQDIIENGSSKGERVNDQVSEKNNQGNGHESDAESDVDTDSSSVYSVLEDEEEDDDTSSSGEDDDDNDYKQDESLSDLEDEEVGDVEVNPKMKSIELPKPFEFSKPEINEYEYDSSDEEDIRNTVGNIPMEWYNDYGHLGYDWDGKKIMKPAATDEIDEFLNKMDDPYYWRTVNDPMTGRNVILSNKDVDIIKRMQKGRYPDKKYDPYTPWSDFFSHETMIHPVTNQAPSKQSFVPSRSDRQKVSRYVYLIKMGRMNPRPQKTEADDEPKYYLIWENNNDPVHKRVQHRIPAPKMKLPGHEESYNPPPEYLFTPEEEEKWKNQEPHLRKLNFIPQKYASLRAVPAYEYFVRERFERCLDLYLCPRTRKEKLNIDPESLIPKLPKPKDLHPFPTTLTLVYKGNEDKVRCLTVEPYGQFLASGCDDGTVKIWEVLTGRCFSSIKMEGAIKSIAWCPNATICAIAVAVNNNVVILNPKVGDKLVFGNTDHLLGTPIDEANKAGTSSAVVWRLATDEEQIKGYRIIVEHPKPLKQVTWHCKGDYFATVMSSAGNKSVLMHQLTKRHSQEPFRRNKGLIQCVLFHPIRPFFFVATQRYVRVYNLMKQELSKKLMSNCKWISSMAVHPQGDNLIIGSYDSRLSWFDLDLSSKPYQTLRHHTKALRQVAYHRRYPLFASASDDASVIVCHGAVYNDFLQNPLLVPVKILRGHSTRDDLSVLDCQFHPTQPWIFTSGADGKIFLYT